ncbi:hypothetical protein ACHWQZ_G003752 [Mnemiopsis leidyi]
MKLIVVVSIWLFIRDGKSQSEIQTEDVTAPSGTEVVLSCTVTGLGAALEFAKWRRADGPEEIAAGIPGFTVDQGEFKEGRQTTTLTVSGHRNEEDTQYVCLVKPDSQKEMEASVSILVTASDSEWLAVEIEKEIDFDIEITPLEIRTDSPLGSGEKLAVIYINQQGDQAGGLNLTFNSKLEVSVSKCNQNVTLQDEPLTDMPGTLEKWWRLTVSSEGATETRLQLHCNEMEVMRVVLSDVKCTGYEGEAGKIVFLGSDTASDFYRAYKPEWVNVQREQTMEHDLERIPIEVRMSAVIGDATATVDVIFRDAKDNYIGQFYFGFAKPDYKVYSCFTGSFDNKFPAGGVNSDTVIKITKSETEGGSTISMFFNEVQVVKYNISGENGCNSSYYGDVKKIEFYRLDHGDKSYKVPRGSPCQDDEVCSCDPGFTGINCQIYAGSEETDSTESGETGNTETDTGNTETDTGDTETDSTDTGDTEPKEREGCSESQFECADKSGCILREWTCDGVAHCQDTSDESGTFCTGGKTRNFNMACPPLSLPDNTSHLNYTSPTTCIYFCVGNSTVFLTGMSRDLASTLTVTCDPDTAQWSHMTDDNPLGLFPTCRKPTSVTQSIGWSATYNITEGDTSDLNCPDGETSVRDVVQDGFKDWESMYSQSILCRDGVPEGGEFCFYVKDGGQCEELVESRQLNLTAIIGVQNSNSSRDMGFFSEVLRDYLSDTTFSINSRGKKYEKHNSIFVVVGTCEPGSVTILSSGQHHCLPCDVGEYHNTATDTCLPCPKNTTGPNIGATKCNSCGGDKSVTAGIGSRSDTDCIGEKDVCTVPGDRYGRRWPSPKTKVAAGTVVWTFCTEQGYSLVDNVPKVVCDRLKDSPQQCVNNQTAVKDCTKRTESSSVYGKYSWPNTKAGTVVKLPCQFNNDRNALKSCSLSGVFQSTDFSRCRSAVAEEFEKILTEAKEVLPETQDAISDNIKTTTQQSGDKMSSEDVRTTTKIIDRVLDLEVSETALNNLILTIDNVQTKTEFNEMQEKEASGKFRESAVKIASQIAQGTTGIKFKTLESVGFAVASASPDDQNAQQLILAGKTNVISGSKNEQTSETSTFFKAELPTTAGQVATAVYYETDKSYPSSAVSSTNTLSSFQGIAQKIADDSNKGNMEEGKISLVATIISDINIVQKGQQSTIVPLGQGQKVTMNFVVKDETERKVHTYTRRKTSVSSQLTCKYYDISKSDWSTEGCTTVNSGTGTTGETGVTCSCNHLSSFAVLMILKMKSVRINLMLVLANIVSIVCFFLMDLFVVETETQANIGCAIIAFLLNYFWLCQLAWMIIEAATMYLALVKVFGTYISNAMFKYSMFGWLLPLVFPIIAVAWGGGNDFADSKTCFIKYPYGIASFYVPVVVGVMSNWVLFIFIVRVILVASKTKAEKMGDSSVKMRTKQLQSALAVSTLLGLGWIVGFFLLVDNTNYSRINTILRWLFILLNAPQGLFIFLFYVLLKEDMRKFWHQKIFRPKKNLGISSTGVDSKGQKTFGTDQTSSRQNAIMLSTVVSNSRSSPHHTPLLPRHNPISADSTSIKDDSETVELDMTVCNSDPKEESKTEMIGNDVGEAEEKIYCDTNEIVIVNPMTGECLSNEEVSLSDIAETKDNENSESQNIILENYTTTDIDETEISSENIFDEVTYSEISGSLKDEENKSLEDIDADVSKIEDVEEALPIQNDSTSKEDLSVKIQQNKDDSKLTEESQPVSDEEYALPQIVVEELKEVKSLELGSVGQDQHSEGGTKNRFALKVRMAKAVTAMLSRKAMSNQPNKRRWILRRAPKSEVEETEVKDSYKGPRLNKYGNFCEEKDSTIERRLQAQLRKAESLNYELSQKGDESEIFEVNLHKSCFTREILKDFSKYEYNNLPFE